MVWLGLCDDEEACAVEQLDARHLRVGGVWAYGGGEDCGVGKLLLCGLRRRA